MPSPVTASAVASAKAAGLRYVNDDEPGITRRKAGSGYRYYFSDGRAVRDKQILERIRKLAIPPAYRDVWICADADGHIQAVGRDDRGRKQYRYHEDWRAFRDADKFSRMASFSRALPALRARVSRDLRADGMPKEKVIATVIRLLDRTALRVGNDEYARHNGSYGLTTLENRHVKLRGARVTFRFRGKGGKLREVDCEDRLVARVLARCQDLPGHRLFEYVDETGQVQRITSSDINEYLREVTGAEFSAKDFRTWHGSLEFALAAERALAQYGAVNRSVLKAVLEQTAQRLGNTPSICRKCYVHPALVEGFLGRALPQFRSTARNGHPARSASREERALGRFLRTAS